MVSASARSTTRPAADPGRPRLEEVADGVYAHVQPDGGWCLNNAGILTGGGRTLLVDTAATERRTLLLRDSLAEIAGGEPDVLVNTHHHSDHTFGNSLFGPRTLVLAHEATRAESEAAGLGLQSLFPDVEWGAVSVRLPDAGYRDAMVLRLGALRVELLHLGPAHTGNDTVVWVPERRVLFTGDVVMSGVTPYTLMGSVSGSIAVLQKLRELRPAVVVPGHGPVAGPEVIDANLDYLRWVTGLAAESATAGLTALQAARDAELGAFADLLDSERLVSNLRRARADAAGEPPFGPAQIVASFTEMLEFHGGPPISAA